MGLQKYRETKREAGEVEVVLYKVTVTPFSVYSPFPKGSTRRGRDLSLKSPLPPLEKEEQILRLVDSPPPLEKEE